MSGILVPIAFFAMIAAIFIVPRYFKSREREELQQTIRAAIERGQPMPQEVIEAMTSNVTVRVRSSAASDMRKAVIWIAVALGITVCAYSIDSDDGFYPMLAVASIPGLVGLAFLAMAAITHFSTPKVTS